MHVAGTTNSAITKCPKSFEMAKKVLVTGASGLLGREILKCFVAEKWEVLGLAYSRARDNLKKVDLCDPAQVEDVLEQYKPAVVVHSAAERRPDVVENQRDKTIALNVSATQTLADLCNQRNIYLLYISSDYVFDGKNPPYAPNATTNPLNAYGVSKRDGERVVLQHPKLGVLRVPVLYGPIEYLGESAVTTLFSGVKDSTKSVKMCDHQQRYPTHVTNCGQVCVGLAELHLASGTDTASPASGIWHFSGKEPFTKYTMALTMAEIFGLSKDHLIPMKEQSQSGAIRPYDCQLDSSATEKAIPNIPYISYRDGIKAALEPFLH